MDKFKPRKILLVWIGRLGDVIVSTPFINALKQKYPQAEITLLVRSYAKSLALMISSVDNVVVLPVLKNPFSFFRFCRNMIFTRYDLCVDLNSSYSRTSGVLVLSSKAPVRVSFEKFRSKWFYTHTIDAPKETEHMLNRYRRLAEFFDACYTPQMTLEISEKDKQTAERIFENSKIKNSDFKVFIHPGNFKKHGLRWPKEKFIALSKKIAELSNVTQVYLTGPGEEKEISAMLKQLPASVRQILPQSIGVTCGLFKKANLFIGCGTGTMHIAAAMQTPILAILNQYAYDCWRPSNENTVSLSSGDWNTCRTLEVEKVWRAFLNIYLT